MRHFVGRTACLAVATLVATLGSTPAHAASTGPTFSYRPVHGLVGTVITISNGGCTSPQVGGDAIALYRASDGALVDVKVQLGNPPGRRPWSTSLTVKATLTTPSGSTPTTTRGAYKVALFCDIGSSFRTPPGPDQTRLASATLSKPFIVGTVPAAPGIGPVTAGNASALVRWTVPSNGGSAITRYTVQVVRSTTRVQVGLLRSAAAGAVSLRVTGLVNGTPVKFRVRATNAVGAGPYSLFSATVTPATVPRGPVIGTASSGVTGGAVNAVARWSPPTSNGGSAITSYVVTALRVSATGAVLSRTNSAAQRATARSLTMTVVAGRYRFVVRARNRVGLSANSATSNTVTAR